MLPNKVIKAGVRQTCYGVAVILIIDGQRALAFPDQIDTTDRESIDNWHPTLCWPVSEDLNNIRHFPPGPMLPGWDIVGAYKGGINEDPWTQYGIIPLHKLNNNPIEGDPDSVLPDPLLSSSHANTALDFAERAVKKLNYPDWVMRFIRFHRLHLTTRRR